MNTFKNDNSYYLVRRAQLKILMRSYFRNGELFEIMNRKAFTDMATKLADKYFHKTGSTIYEEVIEMYKIYLCLAPIIQKQKNSFKVDWTKGHALSWIQRLFNNRTKHWNYSVETLLRRHDPEKFQIVFRNIGISDSAFLDFALERYLCFWNSEGRKGSLANCIFDPFFFKSTGSGLRIENTLIRTSKEHKPDFFSIFERPLEIMCYTIAGYDIYGRKRVDIRLSDTYVNAVKQRLTSIIALQVTSEYKLTLVTALANSFIENAKYARDSFEQIKEMQRQYIKAVKKLAAGNVEFRKTAGSLAAMWLDRHTKFSIRGANFFWDKDHNAVPEKIYMIYFSPYREQI